MIFLCPMSNFDVSLPEDPSVNSLVGLSSLIRRYYLPRLIRRPLSAGFVQLMENDMRKQATC